MTEHTLKSFEEALIAFRPDLVLMDILLPGGVSGYDLARCLRQDERYATLGHTIARRNFHTETPDTMGPNTTIKAVTCAGGRKCIHTAVATMANAKPARPLTNAAANAPMANNARWSV